VSVPPLKQNPSSTLYPQKGPSPPIPDHDLTLRGFMVLVSVPSSMLKGSASTAKARTRSWGARPARVRSTSPCRRSQAGEAGQGPFTVGLTG